MAKKVSAPLTVYVDNVPYSVAAGTPLSELNDGVREQLETYHASLIFDPEEGETPGSVLNDNYGFTDGLNPVTGGKTQSEASFAGDSLKVDATSSESSEEANAVRKANEAEADAKKAADAAKARTEAEKATNAAKPNTSSAASGNTNTSGTNR